MKIHLEDDIEEVLPYLNASLDNCNYDHDTRILLWDDKGRRYAFRQHEIDIAPVVDREEALVIADNIVDLVNDIWNRRHTIEPSFEGKRPPPNTLDIYKLLPRTNCKECGFPTCMAYASDLREGKVELAQCTELSQPQYSDNLVRLRDILQAPAC
jgi:ArsR family metal-binding transcriptional regulator